MLDQRIEKFTLTQTATLIANATGEISKAFGLLKKKATGGQEQGWFHRAEHIFAEASRTGRELLASTTPSLRAAIDALAPIPVLTFENGDDQPDRRDDGEAADRTGDHFEDRD